MKVRPRSYIMHETFKKRTDYKASNNVEEYASFDISIF